MKKKLLTVLLACILCLNLAGTAFASSGPQFRPPDSGSSEDNKDDDNDDKDDDKDDDQNHNDGSNGGNTTVVAPTPAPSDTSERDTSRKPSSGSGEEKGPEIRFKTGENGTITLSPENPQKGDTVKIQVSPKEGYIVGSITVTTNSGKNVMLMNLGSEGYSFTMPGEKITIATTWRELAPAAPQVTFSDVPATEWFATAIAYVSQNAIMAGNNGKFSPNERLTRGMMAQILYNMEKASAAGTASFPDVPATEWYAASAAWASSKGFMSGYSNGNFGPNDPITREQLATILHRYATVKSYDTTPSADISTFSDGAATSDWSAQAVRWAVGSGLLSGKTGVGGSRLDPTGTATRAEVAQILMNNATKIATKTKTANETDKKADETDKDADEADKDADETDKDADEADKDADKTDKDADEADKDADKTE